MLDSSVSVNIFEFRSWKFCMCQEARGVVALDSLSFIQKADDPTLFEDADVVVHAGLPWT